MSFISDVILTMTSVEDDGTSGCPVWPAVDFVRTWLAENHRGGGHLFEVSPPSQDQYCPTGVWVGEFNHLHMERFIEAVRAAPWRWREKVVLFVRDERTEVFCAVPMDAP